MRAPAMSANQPATDNKKVTTVAVDNPDDFKGTLKRIGGSRSDHWNNVLINQTARTLWIKHSDEETHDQQCSATVAALIGIGPKDELEGMIAAQLLAAHNAAMECYRRAMLGEQTFEGRRENLGQANKLSRTYAVLHDALNHHRGKGQQKVTVEHVHVHSGGQAVVGTVEGGGSQPKSEEQPHAIAFTPGIEMPSPNAERPTVPSASNVEWPLPDARRNVAGRSERLQECLQARALHGRGDCKPARDRGALADDESPREGYRRGGINLPAVGAFPPTRMATSRPSPFNGRLKTRSAFSSKPVDHRCDKGAYAVPFGPVSIMPLLSGSGRQ
jgi:hypothetical protein